MLAHLLDPAGDAIAVLRPERIKNFQDHQIERSLEDFRFLRFCASSFGHTNEDTLLPMECPQVSCKVRRVSRRLRKSKGTEVIGVPGEILIFVIVAASKRSQAPKSFVRIVLVVRQGRWLASECRSGAYVKTFSNFSEDVNLPLNAVHQLMQKRSATFLKMHSPTEKIIAMYGDDSD